MRRRRSNTTLAILVVANKQRKRRKRRKSLGELFENLKFSFVCLSKRKKCKLKLFKKLKKELRMQIFEI